MRWRAHEPTPHDDCAAQEGPPDIPGHEARPTGTSLRPASRRTQLFSCRSAEPGIQAVCRGYKKGPASRTGRNFPTKNVTQ